MGTKGAEHFFSGGEGKILKRQGVGVIQLLFFKTVPAKEISILLTP